MNRIATKLPDGQTPAHRRRPILLLLALLTLGPAVVLAQTWTTIDCPDSFRHRRSSHQRRGDIVGICEDADRSTRLSAPARPLHDDRRPRRGGGVDSGLRHQQSGRRGRTLRRRRRRPPRVSAPARPLYDDRSAGLGLRPSPAASTISGGSSASTRASDDIFHGFILDSSGYRDIDFPDADSTAAFDINALKQIVGGYIDTSGIPHGFVLKKGVFSSIDYPDAAGTRAFGINILGHIVGGWTDDPECPDCFTKAFLLTPGRVREPGVPWSVRDRGQRDQCRGPDRGRVLR